MFGTQEWALAFKDAVNANPNYKEAASWWEGDFIFEIHPSGNLDKELRMFIGLLKGDCTAVKALADGEEYEALAANAPPRPLGEGKIGAEFVFSGTYDNWVKVLNKELDPIQGLMAGKFKLVGNMAKVMRATKAAQELVNSTTMVDTQYY